MTTAYRQKVMNFSTKLIDMSKGAWEKDAWGNLKITKKDGRDYRIHFKKTVARYEVKNSSGDWDRVRSANIKDLAVALNENGKVIISGFWKF